MKSKIITVLKVLVLVVIIAWMVLFVVDYFRARGGNKPLVCLSETTKTNSKGTYYQCVSFGYKYFEYDGTAATPGYGFGAAFIKTEIEKNWEE